MAARSFVFTSESVSEGHPDKVCDQISDSILDAFLAQDPNSRVALETAVKTGMVLLAGEITSQGRINYDEIVRNTLRKIGYTSTAVGCDADSVAVLVNVTQQSADIAQGVDEKEASEKSLGAGDQGIMFGFACNETPELMPLPVALSHRIVERLAQIRHSGEVSYLRPDSKSQVTVQYVDGKPKAVTAVVVSTQHDESVSNKELEDLVINKVIKEVVPAELLTAETKYHINPTGRFVVGGPHADAGLTGRKIIVDTYGGYSRHGGGAFSGKDPSKVDRSAAYAARYAAKNVVAAGLAEKCEIQLAYAIGVSEPISIFVDTFGTNKVEEEKIETALRQVFDFSPAGIIKALGLKKPIFAKTASYGHFGRSAGSDGSFSWEKTDLADKLKAAV